MVHPPVDVEAFYYRTPKDMFLMVSELVSYKRLDYAIRHFSHTGRKLCVVGDGPEYRSLKRQSGASVGILRSRLLRGPSGTVRNLAGAGRAGRRGFRNHDGRGPRKW